MPEGFAGIEEHAADIEQRKLAGSSGPRWLYFNIAEPGQSAVVRFLEQADKVAWAYVHQFPPIGKQKYGDKVPCCNQSKSPQGCPMCERGENKGFQGFINVIWRNAPIYQRDQQNYVVKNPATGKPIVVGQADQIAVWKQGITVFNQLHALEKAVGGIATRDFQVTRFGTGLQTSYNILPANMNEGASPLSPADLQLAAAKNDFSEVIKPTPYDVMLARMGGATPAQAEQGGGQSVEQAVAASPFRPAAAPVPVAQQPGAQPEINLGAFGG